MPKFEKHCSDCVRELGEPFEEVHLWLDELFSKLGPKHRDARHHQGGIEDIRRRWGDRAARAAEIHILADCGIIPTKQQAQMWSLFGSAGIPKSGESFLSDQEAFGEDEDKDKT